jgi:hypothetical protein
MAGVATLGAIFRACGGEYLRRHGATARQRAVMRHIATCHTPVLGGYEYQCESCGRTAIAWHSCRDRHCPDCQRKESAEWVDRMRSRLLPTHYFHLVFTIPHELNLIVLLNKERCYDIHFKAVAESIKTVLGDPKRLGARPAFTAVLHTWTQELAYHVHIHCIVSGGGLSLDGTTWVPSRRNYLVPERVLSPVFRGKYLDFLARAYADRECPLELPGDAAVYADPDEFRRLKDRLYRKKWVVYAKAPLQGALAVATYFAGYTHRVGISNKRILGMDDGRVRFLARHRARDGTYLGMRERELSADSFIGRFLLHVLPHSYTRIRHYGITAPGNMKTLVPLATRLIVQAGALLEPPAAAGSAPVTAPPLAPPPEQPVCPHCGGRVLLARRIEPLRQDPFDSS